MKIENSSLAGTIVSINPLRATAGSWIDIEVVNFTKIENFEIRFNGVKTSNYTIDLRNSNGTIRAMVPLTATSGKIMISSNDKTVFSDQDFIVLPLPDPVIHGLVPLNAGVGDTIKITGGNFFYKTDLNTRVFVGEAQAKISFLSSSMIYFIIPSGARSGKIKVKVNDQEGWSQQELNILK